MDNVDAIIQTVRDALAEDASGEARSAGAAACREILQHLAPDSAANAESSAAASGARIPAFGPVVHTSDATRPTMPEIAALAAAIRTVPVDQLLDLAITKLRALLPDEPAKPTSPGLSIPLIPVPRRSR